MLLPSTRCRCRHHTNGKFARRSPAVRGRSIGSLRLVRTTTQPTTGRKLPPNFFTRRYPRGRRRIASTPAATGANARNKAIATNRTERNSRDIVICSNAPADHHHPCPATAEEDKLRGDTSNRTTDLLFSVSLGDRSRGRKNRVRPLTCCRCTRRWAPLGRGSSRCQSRTASARASVVSSVLGVGDAPRETRVAIAQRGHDTQTIKSGVRGEEGREWGELRR